MTTPRKFNPALNGQWRSCSTRASFDNVRDARAQCKDDRGEYPYDCPLCGKWHVTSMPRNKLRWALRTSPLNNRTTPMPFDPSPSSRHRFEHHVVISTQELTFPPACPYTKTNEKKT